MAHSAHAIANEFLRRAGQDGLDPMKLLKLVYLAQGWMLGLYSESLVSDDVEAWRYGPVYRNLYRFVAGANRIHDRVAFPFIGRAPRLDDRETHLVDQVWQKYGDKSGLQLSALTHAPNSPWDITYRNFGQNAVIPKDLIRDHYQTLAA